jgi:hypothetical protein
MAAKVTDIDTLRCYMDSIMARAEENTVGVIVITLALLGGIVWQGDPGSFKLQLYDGDVPVNVLRASFGGREMTFSYNHETATIEMREGTIHGPVLRKFNNRMFEHELESFFSAMRHRPGVLR